MKHSDQTVPVCPLGEPACPRIDELLQARAETQALTRLVHVDALTGLYNYRHFMQAMEQEMARTRRSGQPLSLVMLDLDHFKQVNDRWGHEGGNRVLQYCAGLMRRHLRRVDIPCRYGGEEFALIMPATPLPLAVNAAERLRRAVADSVIPFEGEEIRVTVSMGADVCMPDDELSVEALVERADALLYQAKRQGRNRICHGDYARLQPKSRVGRDEKRELLE